MNTVDTLVDFLNEIDGQGYKAYKGLRGTWSFPDFTLHVDHVQGDRSHGGPELVLSF